MRVTMLAVGNGSCYLVRSGGHTLMFDCGSQSYLDVGTRTVAPALAALHVHRIDMLMLSHADIDHYCGTLDVADAVPVDRVLMTGQMLDEARQEPWAAIGHLLAGLKSRHLPIVQVQRGWRGTLGRAKLSLLWPPRDFLAKQDNDMCMVLSVRAGHRRLLLNGDIQQIAMQGLFAHRTHLRADVTDLPHHGSFVEDSPRWFARVDPLLVLQSTGPARLANDQWTRLLMGTDVQRYITARQGMVRLRVASDGRMWVKTFLGRSSGWRLVESAKPAARRQAVKSAAPAR